VKTTRPLTVKMFLMTRKAQQLIYSLCFENNFTFGFVGDFLKLIGSILILISMSKFKNRILKKTKKNFENYFFRMGQKKC